MQRRLILAASGGLLATPTLLRRAQAQGAAPAAATAQAPGFYRFKLGSFTVTMAHEGFVTRPVEGFVVNKPLAEVQQSLRDNFLPTDTLPIPFTVTVVDTGRALVVFDTGFGPGVVPTASSFFSNLRASGLDPARVTHVVVSHFHGDHITGLADNAGAALFPNAEIVVPETEWKFWTDASNEARSPAFQKQQFPNVAKRFAPYQAQNRIRQIADGAEAVPGIRAVAAYGHTPGHTAYHIADGNAQMMYVADATNRPVPLALHPDFQIVFDFDPTMAEATRRRIYDRVSADRLLITGFHFPFPATGHMLREAGGYRFIPSDWSSAI